jgi:hypothetical protein
MNESPKRFPLLATGYDRTQQDTPIMLDGMEVLFERTVGLYPVTLDPHRKAEASASAASPRKNGLH